MERYRLAPEQLIWQCDPAVFEFASTADLSGLDEPIGQERALTAIDFGLGIRDHGFNLFILGEPGTGRSSTIKKMLVRRAASEAIPDDWCYVHDFADGARPTHINLPAGVGRALQKDVEALVARLIEEIPKVFESKDYEQHKNRINGEFQEKHRLLFEEMEEAARREGSSCSVRSAAWPWCRPRTASPSRSRGSRS